MILTKTLMITWNSGKKKYYESKGYKFTKMGNEFECKFEDVPHSSDRFVDCRCDYCNKEYPIQIKKHYRGNDIIDKDACKDCAGIKGIEIKKIKYGTANPNIHGRVKEKWLERNIPLKIKTLNSMIQKFKEKDYIMLPAIYVNNETKMPYVCKKHIEKGIQWINWIHLKSGRGCYYCGKESMVEKQKYSINEVRTMIENNCKNKLISSIYTGYDDYNLSISCEDCGNSYVTSLGWFLQGKTKCNDCTASIGEQNVINYLKNNNINYNREYEIFTKKRKNPLYFDFYLKQLNLAIEFDGEQHFYPVDFKGGGIEEATKEFEELQIRDKEKNEYCLNNNITLLRIPYWERENINNVLDDYFVNNSQQYVVKCIDYIVQNNEKIKPKYRTA